jgi:Zn-dependent oligopeptidase
LLTFNEVTTMFHEFGHALHGMFSRVHYPIFSGTAVPRDFVEFPSQVNADWALEPSVFANYAKHHQTGAPMPQALVDKIKQSRTFNQGFATTEQVSASLLDMAWHTLPPGAPPQDVKTLEDETLKRFNIVTPEVPPRYRTTYFNHIWSSGFGICSCPGEEPRRQTCCTGISEEGIRVSTRCSSRGVYAKRGSANKRARGTPWGMQVSSLKSELISAQWL